MRAHWSLAALLSFMGPAGTAAAQNSPSDPRDLADEIRLQATAMKLGFSTGRSTGRAFFRANFQTDCASLMARMGDVERVFNESGIFTAGVGDDPYLIGYASGWVTSFTEKYRETWSPCEVDLSDAVRSALRARVDDCRARAEEVARETPVNALFDLLGNHEAGRQARRKMIALVQLSRKREAWEALLGHASGQAFSLPCQAALTDGLVDSLEQRSSGDPHP